MAMIQLPPDFKNFLRLLNEKEVEYLLIGGYAVAHYGYIRGTSDMGFWVATSDENAAKILDALNEFGFSGVDKDSFLKPGQVARMGLPPFRIELSTSIDGVVETCDARSVTTELDGVDVHMISLEDLRTNNIQVPFTRQNTTLDLGRKLGDR